MTLEFDVLQLKDANQEKHMQTLLMSMFYELGLVSHFKIPDATLARYCILSLLKTKQISNQQACIT